jgi:hypothetical protein
VGKNSLDRTQNTHTHYSKIHKMDFSQNLKLPLSNHLIKRIKGKREMSKNDEGDESNKDYCKNICKCHNVPHTHTTLIC